VKEARLLLPYPPRPAKSSISLSILRYPAILQSWNDKKTEHCMEVRTNHDPETQRALAGWAAFTRYTTIAVIAKVVLLGLLALVLL
jgi:hypothetical protein